MDFVDMDMDLWVILCLWTLNYTITSCSKWGHKLQLHSKNYYKTGQNLTAWLWHWSFLGFLSCALSVKAIKNIRIIELRMVLKMSPAIICGLFMTCDLSAIAIKGKFNFRTLNHRWLWSWHCWRVLVMCLWEGILQGLQLSL